MKSLSIGGREMFSSIMSSLTNSSVVISIVLSDLFSSEMRSDRLKIGIYYCTIYERLFI